ncbi:MAG: serine/threonine-protein kinase [Pyrinomonadaceae bacterium]
MQESILSNRYRILQKLGEGGFGQTFLAEDLQLPTSPRCVVKRLKPEFADAETFQLARRLFEQEADILYRLGNHPNIPNLLAHFEDDGEFFLVQELIEGWTLAAEFDGGRIYHEREAVDLLRQILETLAFVHSQNVIHRDIKPSNLIRRKSDGKIFLIDFGAVKQVSVNPLNQSPTFQSTVAIGSHGYMPSEQTAGKPRFASDLYGAGLVVIEALTAMNPLQLNQNRSTGEFIWLHKTRVHGEIGNFISRLVRYDFRQRHLSAKEAFSALNMLASSLGYGRVNPIQVQANQPLKQFQAVQPVQPPPVAKSPEQELIPPTMPAVPNNQTTFVRLPQQVYQNEPRQEAKGFLNSLWHNDIALGGVVVALVFGFFFILGYAVVSYAIAGNKTETVAPTTASSTQLDIKAPKAYEEAETQAYEAETKQNRATTKYEWDEIGNQYKRAYQLMASVDQTNPNYTSAQERMSEYQRKSEFAFQKSAEIAYNKSSTMPTSTTTNYPTSSNYPSSSYSSSYPTPTPAPPKVTMPSKQSYRTYLSYSYLNYGKLETKVVTTDDAIFTSRVEKQSDNRRDSGVVQINIDGGSYNSSRLAFKAPYGYKVTAGTFSNAQEYLWQSPTMYAMSFDKLHCYEKANHSFTVNSIIYDELYSSIAYIDASFTVNCGTSKAMGRIRYDAR